MQIVEIDQNTVIKIMNMFDEAKHETDAIKVGFRVGISTTLDLLGIRIDGVNWYPDQEKNDGDSE